MVQTTEEKAAFQRAYYRKNREKIAGQRKAYREKNRERLAAQDRTRYQAHSEKKAAYDQVRYQANRERVRARAKRYREKNPEKVAAQHKRYRETNREKEAARLAAWCQANPEKMLASSARRRARKLGTEVKDCPRVKAFYSIASWLRSKGDDVHVDHIIPLSRGGTHTHDNLQILPAGENLRKHAKLPSELHDQSPSRVVTMSQCSA